jgi:hypothetical protein
MEETMSPSLREAIEAAYEQTVGAAEAAEKPTPPRDEAGRFASQAAAPPEQPADAAPEAEAEPDDFDDAVGLDRDIWKQTPAQARERAKALAAEARAAAERAQALEPIDRLLTPRRDALRATFGSEAQAIEQLLHASDWAGRDPAGFVRHFAEQRGLDLRTLAPAPAAPQGQAAEAPVQDIDARVRAAIAEAEAQRAINDFDRNETYEFRADPKVRATMRALLIGNVAADLPTAYAMATQAHPDISAKLAERLTAERAKQEAADRARRATEKAAATAVVRGAPGTAAAPAQAVPKTVREAVEQAFEAAGGRI